MAIVSISEAARLTGKSRTTIHRYIKEGKLSKCSDSEHQQGIDISELMRVFGEIKSARSVHSEHVNTEQYEHDITSKEPINELLEHENEQLKKQIELLQDHVNSLKQAMLMLENKEKAPAPEPAPVTVKKPWWKVFS